MFLIDTSSFLVLVKYYLEHDKTLLLYNTIKSKLENKEIILIQEVYNECRSVSQKIVSTKLPFLRDHVSNTEDYVATPKFHKLLVNHLCNSNFRGLDDATKEVEKNKYLNGADCKLILFAIDNREVRPVIVTEENQLDNDQKYFKKLPQMCGHTDINIPTISLPTMLKDFDEIDISFNSVK